MAYGLEVTVNGKVIRSLDWVPFNYLDNFTLAAGTASGSKTYTIGAGRVLEVFADNPRCNQNNPSFTVTVSGNKVTWVKNNDTSICNIDVIGRGA